MQSDVIAYLSSPGTYPEGGPVEVIGTHGAVIFLSGDTALKIKRAVTYDYMDLSTLNLREAMLRRELELNQPIAPKVYRDVVAVTKTRDGQLEIDGPGPPVEWVLRMWRFPAESELSVISETRGIDDTLAQALGAAVFDYHAQSHLRKADGAKLLEDILDELDRVYSEMTDVLGGALIARFHRVSREVLSGIVPLLRARSASGHVRRCHGDLHLRNIVLLDGLPVPFDALEFDEVLGTCDVLYDLAFLIMDLVHRHHDRAANIVLNAYLLEADGQEDHGLEALPFFLGVRAAIHAMVQVQTAQATNSEPGLQPVEMLEEAIAFISPCPATLICVGGLSGTGKTTIAKAVAPGIGCAPGAVHLRSDLERKAMAGVHADTALNETHYTDKAHEAVYRKLFERAEAVLKAGHSVLIDATFLNPDLRLMAMELGQSAGVKPHFLWLDAPLDVLVARVRSRVGDASDADEKVLLRQASTMSAPADWRRISSVGSEKDVVSRVQAVLKSS